MREGSGEETVSKAAGRSAGSPGDPPPSARPAAEPEEHLSATGRREPKGNLQTGGLSLFFSLFFPVSY